MQPTQNSTKNNDSVPQFLHSKNQNFGKVNNLIKFLQDEKINSLIRILVLANQILSPLMSTYIIYATFTAIPILACPLIFLVTNYIFLTISADMIDSFGVSDMTRH